MHKYYTLVATKFMIMCAHEFPLTYFHSTLELSLPYKDFIFLPFGLDPTLNNLQCVGMQKGLLQFFVQKFVIPYFIYSHNYCCVLGVFHSSLMVQDMCSPRHLFCFLTTLVNTNGPQVIPQLNHIGLGSSLLMRYIKNLICSSFV